MPDYQKGKIYAIRSYQTDDIYIGSTIQSLSVRLGEHKRRYKMWLEGKHNYTSSYEIIKYNDCYVEEIEKCPCNDKNELNRREGQIIRLMDCVNKRIEGRTRKEYRQDNKEKIKEQSKQYRKDNKEKYNENSRKYYEENKEKFKIHNKKYKKQNKERVKKINSKWGKKKFTCECGSIITNYSKSRHFKTIKHQTYIQSQSN